MPVTSPNCLQDKKFVCFFRELCEKNGIIEYYLMDNSGSFFMLDEDANTSFLIMKNAKDIHYYYDLALKQGASQEMLEQLGSGKKIPGLWQTNFLSQEWGEWSNSLVPASCFVGGETYYFVYLQGNTLFDVRQNKILSYHRYLEELDVEELLMS